MSLHEGCFFIFRSVPSSVAKHPLTVEGFTGSLDALAQSVGNMQYDQTAAFIETLADDIQRQADADSARGRKKLAAQLYATAQELYKARDAMQAAWEICKPYMTK
jgi:molybdenum-dependent DNA-binding transcriptional regulator ModE